MIEQTGASDSKKLLIISYYFPPLRAAATARILGFIRYLAVKGWDVAVLSVTATPDLASDPATLGNVPAKVKVYRCPSFEIGWLLRRILRRPDSGVVSPGQAPTQEAASASSGMRHILKAPLRGLYQLCTFPDTRVGWLIPLVISTWRAIRAQGRPIVLSSSPPHSSQLGPALLKTVCSFHWVADFRDGWTASPYRGENKGWRRRFSRKLEAYILRRCDKVIANTEGNKRALLDSFRFLTEEKVDVVTNGFDARAPLKEVAIHDEETNCDIMHVGALYPQVAGMLASSLSYMKSKYPDRVPRVFIYGPMIDGVLSNFQQAELSDCVFYKGWVGWDHSIHLMRKARSLLLLLPHTHGGSTTVPSKLYAYLFSGRPIILIAPPGDATRLVDSAKAGVCINASDPERIADELLAAMDSIGRGHFVRPLNDRVLDPYTMEQVAAKLERVLTDHA